MSTISDSDAVSTTPITMETVSQTDLNTRASRMRGMIVLSDEYDGKGKAVLTNVDPNAVLMGKQHGSIFYMSKKRLLTMVVAERATGTPFWSVWQAIAYIEYVTGLPVVTMDQLKVQLSKGTPEGLATWGFRGGRPLLGLQPDWPHEEVHAKYTTDGDQPVPANQGVFFCHITRWGGTWAGRGASKDGGYPICVFVNPLQSKDPTRIANRGGWEEYNAKWPGRSEVIIIDSEHGTTPMMYLMERYIKWLYATRSEKKRLVLCDFPELAHAGSVPGFRGIVPLEDALALGLISSRGPSPERPTSSVDSLSRVRAAAQLLPTRLPFYDMFQHSNHKILRPSYATNANVGLDTNLNNQSLGADQSMGVRLTLWTYRAQEKRGLEQMYATRNSSDIPPEDTKLLEEASCVDPAGVLGQETLIALSTAALTMPALKVTPEVRYMTDRHLVSLGGQVQGLPPRSLQCIPWGPHSHGLQPKEKYYPQIVASPTQLVLSWTSIDSFGRMYDGTPERDVMYCNYSSTIVQLVPITAADLHGGVYLFGWEPCGQGRYKVFPLHTLQWVARGFACIGGSLALLKVSNPTLLLGFGSYVTSQHSAFGVLRDAHSLMSQAVDKAEGGVTPSGHMIAALLAHEPHFIHFMSEIGFNFTSKKSIYVLPFNEPNSSVYHSRKEYDSALTSMKVYLKTCTAPQPFIERVNEKIIFATTFLNSWVSE